MNGVLENFKAIKTFILSPRFFLLVNNENFWAFRNNVRTHSPTNFHKCYALLTRDNENLQLKNEMVKMRVAIKNVSTQV